MAEFDHYLRQKQLDELYEKDPEKAQRYILWMYAKKHEYLQKYYQKNKEKISTRARERARTLVRKRKEILEKPITLEISVEPEQARKKIESLESALASILQNDEKFKAEISKILTQVAMLRR